MASVLCGGIALAWAVMFGRIAVEVALVFPTLLAGLARPLGLLALVLAVCALVFARNSRGADDASPDDALERLKSPFQLRAAIQFAGVFAIVLLAAKIVSVSLPTQGVYALAVVSGTVDVDAITLSVAGMAKDGKIGQDVATHAIILAAATNSVMKLLYGMAVGHAALRRRLLVPGGLLLVAGAIASML